MQSGEVCADETASAELERLTQLLYQVPVGIVQADAGGNIVLMNPLVPQLLMPLVEKYGCENLFDLLTPCLPDLRHLVLQFTRRGGEVFKGRRVHVGAFRSNDDPLWLSMTLIKVDQNRLTLVLDDISAQVAAERRARQADAWFTAIMRGADDHMACSLDVWGRVAEWNPTVERLTGWTAEEVVGKPLSVFFPPESGLEETLADRLERAGRTGWDLDEGWRVRRDGTRFYANCLISIDEDGSPTRRFLLVIRDISERRAAVDELRRLATTDYLTGVLNRARFFELAQEEHGRAKRVGRPLAVAMVDVDHFKSVNDGFGHHVGDEVLKGVAELCQRELRSSDILGRLGGEEFAILLPGCNLETAKLVLERIRRGIQERVFPAAGTFLSVTASFGLVVAGQEDGEFESLLRKADKALYTAKDRGRNRVEVG